MFARLNQLEQTGERVRSTVSWSVLRWRAIAARRGRRHQRESDAPPGDEWKDHGGPPGVEGAGAKRRTRSMAALAFLLVRDCCASAGIAKTSRGRSRVTPSYRRKSSHVEHEGDDRPKNMRCRGHGWGPEYRWPAATTRARIRQHIGTKIPRRRQLRASAGDCRYLPAWCQPV